MRPAGGLSPALRGEQRGRKGWWGTVEGLVGNSGRAGGEQSAGGTWCELGRVAKYREQEETDG